MINLWNFADDLPRVRIKTDDGQVFIGETLCVMDAEETDDDEDSITIEMHDGKIIVFYPHEIVFIERVNNKGAGRKR